MNKISYLVVILTAIFMFSCNTEELRRKTEQLDAMQARHIRDSVLLEKFDKEMVEINVLLDSISVMDEDLRGSESISKKDALAKLNLIDSLLQDRNIKIEDLEKDLKDLQSKFSKSLAVGKISEGKNKLKIKTEYYKQLTKQIAQLEQENLDLKDIITQKDNEIVERDSIINLINQEREIQKQKLEDLQAEIIASAKELADATNATAERFYSLGYDLRNISDKTSIIFNKKKKKELLKMSYSYFKRANELGHPDAEKELKLMDTDKKYQKLLKEKEKK